FCSGERLRGGIMMWVAPWKGDGAPWPPPPSATAMKRLWVAVLLLLCVCHVGSVAVPQTEEPPEAPPDTTTLLSRHFQTLSDFITKELPQRLRADEIQQQAKYELRSNVLGLFSSLLDFGKTGGTEKD
uniref:Uncharacterized protein n=1 Tax=Phasianus colchicus TaxID=9054 RepID=A0A669QNY9_PHACC